MEFGNTPGLVSGSSSFVVVVRCRVGASLSMLVPICKHHQSHRAVEIIGEISGNPLKVFSPWSHFPNLREVQE